MDAQSQRLIEGLSRQVRELDREIAELQEKRRWLKGHLRHEILKQRRLAAKA